MLSRSSSSSSACKWQLARSLAAPALSLAECSGSLQGSPALHQPPCLALPQRLLLPTDYTVAAPFDLGQCIDPYCSIWRMDRDGTNRQRVARNVRNAAGYTWHPSTGELLFAGMERDGMGNNGGCSAGKGGFTADAAVLLLLACWMAGWNWCPGLTEPACAPSLLQLRTMCWPRSALMMPPSAAAASPTSNGQSATGALPLLQQCVAY